MKKGLACVICAFIGAGVGAGVAGYFTKKKYEQIRDEEVQSIKDAYNKKAKELAEKNIIRKETELPRYFKEAVPKKEVIGYSEEEEHVVTNVFDKYSTNVEEEEIEEEDDVVTEEDLPADGVELSVMPNKNGGPALITADEYGDQDDYDVETLYFFMGDKVLVDDQDEIVDDPDTAVGIYNLEHAYDDESDALYVRNFQRYIDYEILLDTRSYKDYRGL